MWEAGAVRGGVGLKQWDVTDQLAQIQVPTLMTLGHDDRVVAGQDAIFISGAERRSFAHSAYYPHLEEEEQYLMVLADFLDRVEQGQSRQR